MSKNFMHKFLNLEEPPQKISKTDKEKQKEYEAKRERRFLPKWQSGSQRAWLTYKKRSIVGNTTDKGHPGQLYELCLVNIVRGPVDFHSGRLLWKVASPNGRLGFLPKGHPCNVHTGGTEIIEGKNFSNQGYFTW